MLFRSCVNDFPNSAFEYNKWQKFYVPIIFASQNQYSFEWTLKKQPTYFQNNARLSLDGFKIELVDRSMTLPSIYSQALKKDLKNQSTLILGTFAVGETKTQTISLIDAREFDKVEFYASYLAIATGLSFTDVFVSANDVVSFKAKNNTIAIINNTVGYDYLFNINKD